MFLRMNMFDLAVGIACSAVAGVVAGGREHVTAIACATWALSYFGAAPIAYRLCRARPMHFPKCPHCQAADGPWGIQAASAPDRIEDMQCGQCGKTTSFVYRSDVTLAEMRGEHAYSLRWPRPIGIWKKLH